MRNMGQVRGTKVQKSHLQFCNHVVMHAHNMVAYVDRHVLELAWVGS